jgi:hypothetical protein
MQWNGNCVRARMSQQSEALKERTMSLSVNVLRLNDRFPRSVGAEVTARQLAKSSRSLGTARANSRAVSEMTK